MKRYFISFLLFVSILAGLLAVLSSSTSADIGLIRWMILLYFAVITIAFHAGLVSTTKKRPAVFVRYYMATTTLKLLLHLGVLVIFCLFHRIMATQFIISFMTAYFLFTIFEVGMSWKVKSDFSQSSASNSKTDSHS